MGTNAIAIDKEKADFIGKNNIKCIVSMDGTQNIHNKLGNV